jgi:hypothetical protein
MKVVKFGLAPVVALAVLLKVYVPSFYEVTFAPLWERFMEILRL